MNKLRVAVIGVGNMGRFHARNYAEIPGVDLVAVSDISRELVESAAQEYGCAQYLDYREMIAKERLDLVSVVVPTRFHKDVAIACLERGINILVEKPIASTVEEAEAMVAAAKKIGALMTIGHIERFNPAVQKLKELVDAGRIGEINSVIARRVGVCPPQIKDANVIIDLAVHDIDVINYLLGRTPDEVNAHGGHSVVENRHDYATLFLRYDRASVVIQVNWITPVKIRKLNITGNKGYAELDYITQELTLFESNYSKVTDDFGDFVIKFGLPNKIEVGVGKQEPLKRELLSFIDSVRHKTTPLVKPEEALEALRVALRADNIINQQTPQRARIDRER